MRAMNLKAALLVLVCALSAPASAADPQEAQRLIRESTEQMLQSLREESAAGELEIDRIRAVVEEFILPHVDFVTMTKLAVGRAWLEADRDQKRALVNEFRQMLFNTYALSLREYDDQEFEFLPLEAGDSDDRVEVRARFIDGDDRNVPVGYRLRARDGRWLVYDIRVDGISLVTTYRSSFSNIVSREGIDGLISHLEEKNRNNASEPS